MNCYVVTMPELGWDCVVAIYSLSEVTEEEVLKAYPKSEYIVIQRRLCTRVDILDTIAENEENED